MAQGSVIPSTVSYSTIVYAVIAFSLSSVAMMSGNKVALKAFPLPMTLVFYQAVCTIFILFTKRDELSPLEMRKVKLWFPCTMLFAFMLVTSLLSLHQVSLSTVLIFRNAGSIINAFAEWHFLKRKVSIMVVASLLVTLAGAALYGLTNFTSNTFSTSGLIWIILNIFGQVGYGIYVKFLMDAKSHELNLTKFGMSFYNNVLCLPVLLVLIVATGETSQIIPVSRGVSFGGWIVVFITCVVGFFISVTGFGLQRVVSATAFMVINNANKILNILFGVVILSDPFNGAMPILGCLMSLGGSFWYSYLQFQQAEAEKKQNVDEQRVSFAAIDEEEADILNNSSSSK